MIKKNKTAFSLIELSMVITVFVILIAASFWFSNSLKSQAVIITAQAMTRSSPVKDIPNLQMWLESTTKESFNQNEINGSGNISTWYDINKQSDYQNNATQATSALQPNYQTNIINGLPAVFFSGTASVGMTINTTLNLLENYSVFIVLKTGSTLSQRALQSQSVNWLLGTWGSSCICYYNGTNWVSNSVLQVANKVYLAEAVRNTVSTFYVNGVNDTTTNSLITPPGNLALGATGAFNEPMNGYIAEVIVFSRDLTDPERQDVENYLITKWNIS